MSHARFIYTILTMPKNQAHWPSRKPIRRIGETDELGIEHGPEVSPGIYRRAGHDLPDASRRGIFQRHGCAVGPCSDRPAAG